MNDADYVFLGFLLNPATLMRPAPNRRITAKVDTGPSFRATQLPPTTGSKLQRVSVRKLVCSPMKSATGEEQVSVPSDAIVVNEKASDQSVPAARSA